MEKRTYHETGSHYADMLANIRHEILGQITAALEWLGGKVCLGYYHNEQDFDRYTFFEVNDDGYGEELYIDTIEDDGNGNIEIHLSNSEDCYCPLWSLSDLTATDAINVLTELENVIEHVQATKEEVVKEFSYDYV